MIIFFIVFYLIDQSAILTYLICKFEYANLPTMKNNIYTQNGNTVQTFSDGRIKIILIAILSLYPLVGMGIDLIAPSLPAISHDLNASNNFSKNLITFYLFGYMLGNFLIGFLSDAIGRRKPMLLGFLIFTIISILPAIFNHPLLLLIARFLQGFTIAAFAVSSRAVLSDILPKDRLIRTATLIATMWGIGPIVGPMIGGYLQFYFNWQMCFYFFAFMGLIGFLAMIFIIPETHFHRQPLQYKQLQNNFVMIMTHRVFLGIVMLMGIAYSLLIVFNTLGPFLIQTSLGYSSVYFGQTALFMGLTFLAGTFLCRRLLKQLYPENIFFYAILIFTLISAIGVVLALVYGNKIWVIIVPSLFMFLGCGILYPTAMGKGLSLFRHLAGSASATMNLISISITSITAFVMSFIQANDVLIVAYIYLGLMILASMVYYLLIRAKDSP
jgi:MFS transporter, DHA1 family, multidrug resistance protein